MKLCIDVGNTHTSFAIFSKNILQFKFDLKTERGATAFELFTYIKNAFELFGINPKKLKEVKIASVVPELERILEELFTKIYLLPITFITAKNLPVKINLKNPAEVGVDRLVNVFGALKIYGIKKNVLVIDFGTAITFDIGLKTFEYEGGIIYPGINLSLEALKNNTSKLPKVSLEKPTSPIGKSTSEAINAGIFYGVSSLVNGCVRQIEGSYKSKFLIILTGGFAGVLKEYFDFNFIIDSELTLKGVNLV